MLLIATVVRTVRNVIVTNGLLSMDFERVALL
jgi:hypothetical protein